MKNLKVSIIGCGYISDYYAINLINQNIEIINCFDIDLNRLTSFTKFYGLKKAFSYEEILTNKEINIIINLTPADQHFDVIRKAILHKKNIYTEKPLTLSIEESIQLTELAKEKKVHIWSAPSLIFNDFMKVFRKNFDKDFIKNNVIGYAQFETPRLFSLDVFKWRNPSGKYWPIKSETVNGPIVEHSGYLISLLCSLLGPIKFIDSSPLKIEDPNNKLKDIIGEPNLNLNPNHCVANLYFGNQNFVSLTISENTLFRRSIELHNEEKSFYVSDIRDDFCPIQFTSVNQKGYFSKRVNLFRHILNRICLFIPRSFSSAFISANNFNYEKLYKIPKTPIFDWLQKRKPATFHRGILAMDYMNKNFDKSFNFEDFYLHCNEVTLLLLNRCNKNKLKTTFNHDLLKKDLKKIDQILS